MCVCIETYMHMFIHIHSGILIDIHIHIHVHICMHIHMCIRRDLANQGPIAGTFPEMLLLACFFQASHKQ